MGRGESGQRWSQRGEAERDRESRALQQHGTANWLELAKPCEKETGQHEGTG